MAFPHNQGRNEPKAPLGSARLAIAAALVTMGLKFGAYWLTGSVGLLSDAVESSANLVAASTALFAIWYAARPVDRTHNYGHGKIEFFASGLEGVLVLAAAVGIAWSAVGHLRNPSELDSLGLGTGVAMTATLVNLGVARWLLRVARERGSLVLEADGRHLMTDVWTSLGVVGALLLVWATGIERLDPLIALAIGGNIAWTGVHLVRVSFDGLMDRALPAADVERVRTAIQNELEPGETFHALRTRQSGGRRFVDFHLLIPGELSVRRAHAVTGRLEQAVDTALPGVETVVHVEPIEERAAWEDSPLLLIEGEARTERRDLSSTFHVPRSSESRTDREKPFQA